MAGVEVTSIQDLLNLTLASFEKRQVVQTLGRTNYGLTKLMFMEARQRKSGGKWYEFQIRVRASQTARFVGLYESTPNTIRDVTVVGTEPWGHYEEKVHWDEKQVDMNSDEQEIAEQLLEDYNAAREGVWELIESRLGISPQNATETRTIRGLGYHVRPLAAGVEDAIGGFNGVTVRYQDGTTSTMWCGLDRNVAENTRLPNWAQTYSGEMDQTTIDALRRAMNRTNFQSIDGIKNPIPLRGRRVLVMDDAKYEDYEGMRNRRGTDGKKGDINPDFESPEIRGVGVVQAPVLRDVSYAPIYGLNTRYIYGQVLKNRWMRRKQPVNSRDQVETWTVPIVGTCMVVCRSPREQFVLHTPIAA